MNVPADSTALKARSERLDAYLAQDPGNEQLLADAFEAALAAGRLEAAARHAEVGFSAAGSDAWRFRQVTLAMAQGRLEDAKSQLMQLAPTGDPLHPAVRFNLGYVHFRLGEYRSSAELLEPLLGDMPPAQPVWLRSLHQLGEVERAWGWVDRALSAGQALEAEVCGVASLIAIDAEQLDQAERLADRALHGMPRLAEALVAKGSVALARQDGPSAEKFATAALEQRDDGRARSLLGFARLLRQNLAAALTELERAVLLMPGHVGTWHGLGWTRILLKDLSGAEAAFAQALALDRNFAESHGSCAVVLVLMGRVGEAKAHVARAQRLDPNSMAVRYAELLMSGKGADPRAVERLARQIVAGATAVRGIQDPSAGGASNT